jgi:hypothetical protein
VKCDIIELWIAWFKQLKSPFPVAMTSEVLWTALDRIGGAKYSHRGLWEKLLVPRGKRKAGEAWQMGAIGFWARTREAKGRIARATEDILEYVGK